MAEMLGQLDPQRGLDHPTGQLAQQPARPGDLIGLKALQRVVKRLGRQQLGQPVDRRPRRTLRRLGALRTISLRIRDGADGHRCPSRPQGPNRSPRPHTLHRTDPVSAARRCDRPGIHAHRIALAPDEITHERGIPVTTPARTLLDLAEQLTPQRLERAVHEAEYRRLTSPLSLDALLTRHQGRRGTAALRKIVDQNNLGSTLTRSELEIAFLAFLDAHHLERPKVNERIGPYTVDALWPQQRLVAELDSRQAHQTTRAFDEDRARDRHLLTKGYRVVRVTHRQLHHESATIAAQLRQLLTPDTVRAP
jgi:very-short-patch-repair endonuclease